MIVVRLRGGLGNQMFQYACGFALSMETGVDYCLDTSEVLRDTRHGGFVLSELTPSALASDYSYNKIMQFKRRIIKRFPVFSALSKDIYQESSLTFKLIKFDKSIPTFYLDGYWQSEKYFSQYRDQLLKDFTPSYDLPFAIKNILMEIDSCESTSIHIRRGDYLLDPTANRTHGVLPIEYYQKAMDYIKKHRNPKFFIFSDDPEWAKEQFTFSDAVVVSGLQEGISKQSIDLHIMRHCKHNIIANSSYSWWGAWLNNNPDKIVVAPRNWFRDETLSTDTLLPENWIKI